MIPAALALQLAKTASQAISNRQRKQKNKVNRQKANAQALPNKPKNPSKVPRQQAVGREPFLKALTDPFAPSSLGCKVPDPFPFPTQSYHMHQTSVLGCSTGETSGSVLFLPSPCLSMIDTHHLTTVSTNSVTTSAMTRLSTVSTQINYGMLGASTPSGMNNLLETFRVVSWGVKISNLQPELSATGRIIIGFVPIADATPSYNSLIDTGLVANVINPITGIPASVFDSANILQLPTSVEFTVGDFLHGDIELVGMYTNSAFWTFKSPVLNGLSRAGASTGDELVTANSTGTEIFTGYKDLTRMVGGVAISLYFEGVPASTSNCFQVETIYHLEGTPVISSTAGTSPVPSNTCSPYTGSTLEVEKGMSAVNSVEKVVKFISRGANFLNKNQKTIQSIGKSAGAMMGF